MVPETSNDRLRREAEFHDRLAAELAPDDMPPVALNPRDHAMLDYARIEPGMRVLDMGCGSGDLTFELLRRGARVSALDLSPGMIDLARRRIDRFGPAAEVDWRVSAAERTPFPTGHFDRAVGRFILHHLDLNQAAAELGRILRPGGRAVFVENWGGNPLLMAARDRVAGRFGIPRYGTQDERPLSSEDLDFLRTRFARLRCEFPTFDFFRIFDRQVLRFRWPTASRVLGGADGLLYRRVPSIRRYSFRTIVILDAPTADTAHSA